MLLFATIVQAGCGRGALVDEPPTEAGLPGSQPALGSVISGTVLLKGNFDVFGITTDDVAAVLDSRGGALAVPASGAPTQPIDPAADMVAAAGAVIYAFHGVDPTDTFGELTIWTAAHGAIPFASGATWPIAVSDDGTRVLATAQTSGDGRQTLLVLGGTDGAPATTLFPVALDSGCQPVLKFAGGRFVASVCPPGSSDATVFSIDPADGSSIALLAGARNQITLIPGAQSVALIDQAGRAYLADLAGAALVPVGQAVTQVASSPDGSALFLATEGTISVVPLNGAPSGLLPPAGVIGLSGVSPDGQQLLFQAKEAVRPLSGGLWITSARPGGPFSRLSFEDDTAAASAPAFTADSQWALWFTDPDPSGAGTLMASAVSGGAASVLGQGAVTVAATSGARILYTDASTLGAGGSGRSVLNAADLATGAAPVVLATDAGASFYLTRARDRVVYAFDDGGPRAGIYVAAVP